MILPVTGILLVLLAYGVNRTLLKRLKSLGTQRYAPRVRWSAQAKPTIGGVSFFIGLVATLLCLPFFDLSVIDAVDVSLIYLAVGALAAFLMGLTDDIWQTKPLSKFVVQVACGVLLFLAGVHFPVEGHPAVQAALTIFWTVALMNSINMLDNMDGVSAGVAMATLLTLWYLAPDHPAGFIAFGMACTLLGFLALNTFPSKLFMGDAGSQLLGFLLALLSLVIVNQRLGDNALPGGWLLLPILFGTTLTDTALVTLNRLSFRRSPFRGGRDHSTHHLSYLGWADRMIAMTFTAWSALNGVFVTLLLKLTETSALVGVALVSFFSLAIFATFFRISRVNMKKRHFTYD